MKKLLFILLALFVLMGCGESTGDQASENATDSSTSDEQNEDTDDADSSEKNGSDEDTEEIVTLAEEFIGQLANGEFETATQHFNGTMEAQLTPVALDELWVALEDQLGGFIDQEYSSIEQVDDHQVVLIDGLFESADVVFSVTFDNNNQIAGFYIQ